MGGSVLGSFNHYISICSSFLGSIMIGLILFCLVAVAQSAITPTSKVQLSVAEKLKMADDIQDADLIQDVEQLIEGLDDVTLAKLEKILSDEMSTQDELKLIQDELTEMGMDVEDVQDMLDLAAMMTDFLRKVPDGSGWWLARTHTAWRTTRSCTCSVCPTSWVLWDSSLCIVFSRLMRATLSTSRSESSNRQPAPVKLLQLPQLSTAL